MPAVALAPARRSAKLTGRKVLLIALGAFALVLVANGAFVWFALSGFSGLSREDAYREGLHYNDELAAAAAQKARGWSSSVTLDKTGLAVEVSLPDGRPVAGLLLKAVIGRPATDAFDQTLELLELRPGRYLAPVVLAPGNWSVVVTGEDAAGEPYRAEARLWR